MLKLGMPILYEYNSIEENIELAKKLNLDFIELNLNFSYCRYELEQGKLAKRFKDANLMATLHFYDEADLASYDPVVDAYLSLLDKYLGYAEGLVTMVNFHLQKGPVVTISGNKNYIYEKELIETVPRLLTNFAKAKAICASHGMKMVIEDTDELVPYMTRFYQELAKNNYCFNYDIGHDNLANDVLLNFISETPLKFDEFHFHDANRKKCHLALGTGSMDLKYFKNLAIENDALVLLEVKDSNDLIASVPYFHNL